jgi:hypothetical protein
MADAVSALNLGKLRDFLEPEQLELQLRPGHNNGWWVSISGPVAGTCSFYMSRPFDLDAAVRRVAGMRARAHQAREG